MNYSIVINDKGKRRYVNEEEFTYYSERYDKYVTVPYKYNSDGASGACDIASVGWWVHDILKDEECFDDGSTCTNRQASMVLYDILKSEGRWFRARSWLSATFMWGEVSKLWR